MNKEQLRRVWDEFTESNDFVVNPDGGFVDKLADGLLINEKNHGFRLCPCRPSDGTKERDIQLLCPCNFKTHGTWEKEGRCWCGLFIKRP
jgi:ferredoxin-thioredoxin reductase catalytic subunit